MKSNLITIFMTVLLITVGAGTVASADTYSVDTDHTYILFKVVHLGIGHSYGRFNGATGTLVFDAAMPAKMKVDIQVPAAMVDTHQSKRDQHLKSADFLNAEKHPVIRFVSRRVKKTGDGQFAISGQMTLLGKTRPMTVTAFQTGAGKDPWGNDRVGFETEFTIKRSDFGMDFMLNGVSDAVTLTVSVEGIRQ